MKIVIPKPFAVPIAICSVHGFTDFDKKPTNLLPYLLIPFPSNEKQTSLIFLLSSLYHFSFDIGYLKSIFLHIFWLLGFKYYQNIAWLSFCIFYCCVHVPLTFSDTKFRIVYIPISLLFLKFVNKNGLYVDKTMMKIVISHVLCNLS